jgi:ElaB/YqjD/DUF883 family membrane-anchored ribosome-binding protein
MNDRQLNNKVRKDADRIIKDINTLVGDSSTRFSRFEDDVNQAAGKVKEELSSWVEEGVSKFDRMKGNVKDSVASTAAIVKKDVNRGMIQYNNKAQKIADKLPGGFSRSATKYPWVVISLGLALGFFLGILLKPSRHIIKYAND